MKTAYLLLLAFYTVLSLTTHLYTVSSRSTPPRGKGKAPGSVLRIALIATQLPVFLCALYFAYHDDALTRALLNPVYIGLGLAAGHLIFGVSLLITHRSLEDASGHFLDFGSVWRFGVEHPYVLSRFIYVGVSEEIIWRAAAQPLAVQGLGVIPGLAVVALCFSLVHDHFFRNSLLVSLEFLCFAILLGVLYHWTGSLILVVIIHTVRDIEIAFLEYVVKVHELGDEEEAARDVEAVYTRHQRRTHEKQETDGSA